MSYISNSFDNKTIKIISKGGLGFMPSDTVYGLSCAALNEDAVNKLHTLKKRDGNKPFIILIASINQLTTLGIDKEQASTIFQYWPGAVTIVLPAKSAPDWLTLGRDTLAIRLPDYKELNDFIKQTGPLISTSANFSGDKPVSNFSDAYTLFGENLGFYIDKGNIAGLPSTIVKPENGGLKILRQGAVKIKA